MPPQLPPELLDYIFSFLQDDHAALRSCAKVNPDFSDMVERHLYHQVTLTNLEGFHGVDEYTPAQISGQFNITPRLQSHVRVLRINIATMGVLRWFMKRSMNGEDIAEILPLFSQVTTVFLSGRHNSRISWYRFTQLFQMAFIRLLTQRSVESISINGIDDFTLSLLDQCTTLKRLSLLRMNYPMAFTDLSTESLPGSQRARLRSLDIADCSSALPVILDWFRSPCSPQVQYLSSLRISIHKPGDIEHLQALLETCSDHLKEVYLCANEIARTTYNITHEVVFPPENAPHQVLDLSGLPSLKSLSISGNIKSIDTFWVSSDGQDQIQDYVLDTCIPWFIQLLQTSSFSSLETPHTNLERIVLKITFQIDKHSLTKLDWQPLAAVLRTSANLFPSLRKVEMRAIYCESTTLDYQTLLLMLCGDEHLSPLIQSGLLSIIGNVPQSQRNVVKL